MSFRNASVRAVGPSGFLRFKKPNGKCVVVNIFEIRAIEPYKGGSKVRMKNSSGNDEPGIVYKAKAKPLAFERILAAWGKEKYG